MSLQWIDVSFFVAGKSSHGALFTRPGKHTKTYQLFLWPFSISMLVYQRVNVFIFPKLSKGGGSKPINYNKDPEKLAILGHTGGFDQSHIGWNYIII